MAREQSFAGIEDENPYTFERIRATLLMHQNRGYGTRNVEVDTLPIFINGKSEAMV
jgi:hypothetical protein